MLQITQCTCNKIITKIKSAPYGTVGRLIIGGKIRLPKAEHPKFESHMTNIKNLSS